MISRPRLVVLLIPVLGALALGVFLLRSRSEAPASGAVPPDPSQGVVFLGVAPEGAAAIADTNPAKPPPPAMGSAPAAVEEPAPPPALKPAAAPPEEITVQIGRGDSLWGLVRRTYGTATPDLIDRVARFNHLKDPGALKAGQTLRLPFLEGFPPPRRR